MLLPRLSSKLNDIVKHTDRVLVNRGKISGSGDDPAVELGIHEFKIGDEELLNIILYLFLV